MQRSVAVMHDALAAHDWQLSLPDEIDKLRRSGISDHVSLPQIAVCGDQSSGKSSCLEAISGIPFPRKDTLCTRFATELVLRKSPTESVVVVKDSRVDRTAVTQSQQRSKKESQELANFQYTLESFDELPALIESAKVVLGLDKPGSGVSSDILRIEISGPTRPHLTVVDLPGLIHAKNDNEDDEDVDEVVSELVHSYMRRPRTIILAVVSALNDCALQAVLKRVKAVDPHGRRTMGLITKPDTLFKDSESEKDVVKLALNEVTNFRLVCSVPARPSSSSTSSPSYSAYSKFNSLHTEDLDLADGYSYFIIAGLLSLDWHNVLVSPLQVTMPILIWSATVLLPIAHWLFKTFSPGIYVRYRQARRLQAEELWKIMGREERVGDVEAGGEAVGGDVEEGIDEETPLRRDEGRAGLDA
ncbi:uncharacterized protein BP5553_04910 [Venustampulla echinocandica]|uniref:Dynamin-type G domain-containing protein n=1 Tax=Venustampulla echinocandica TaxID=2656787 RepID=A0A370TPM0_9HELO|nr:uncharacterized protein BP5553_04910 [Venustampulla echinocandica]RDL37477.1 hypothetical protein BP5553_04910 [Venustampulla echinocandica]